MGHPPHPGDDIDNWDVENSAVDELPSDFDDAEGAHRDEVRLPRSASLPGPSLFNQGVYFVLHRPGFHNANMPAVTRALRRDRPDLNVVVSQPLPRMGTVKAAEYFDSFDADSVGWRIADPEGFAMPGDVICDPPLTVPQLTKVGYVAAVPEPGDSHAEWNKRVVNTQRAAGANLLLTPGRSLDPNEPAKAIGRSVQVVNDLLENVASDEYPAWNLTIGSTWLVDDRLRNTLLAELVDHDEISTWYIRVYWPLIKRTYGQTLSPEVLHGYRELCQTATREDKVLILPNSGVTGWRTLAWGSSGFGSGSSSPLQAWSERPKIAARKGVPRSTVDRYYSRPLLHTITVDTHRALQDEMSDEDYPACSCRFCIEQADDIVWRRDLAAQHAAFSFGDMAGAVAQAHDRMSHIADVIADARSTLTAIPNSLELAAAEAPEHLEVWRGLDEDKT